MPSRSLQCVHHKSKYDCPKCGISLCILHRRRIRDCQHCRKDRLTSVPIVRLTISREVHVIPDAYIVKVPMIGCRCPHDQAFRSRIIGCRSVYGCNYNTWACALCAFPYPSYRYRAWVKQHIVSHHPEVVQRRLSYEVNTPSLKPISSRLFNHGPLVKSTLQMDEYRS